MRSLSKGVDIQMGNKNPLRSCGLTLILGPLLVLIIQLAGFMPSFAFIFIVGPITIVIGIILYIIGYATSKE